MFSSLAPTVSDAPAQSSSLPRRELKKALLIGINGLSSPTVDYHLLDGPHRDVAEMKSLLTGAYGYQEEDIQVLVDDGIAGHMQPDRRNIMFAIDNLVHDTQRGDKLFFHYSGHTVRVPSRNNTEEDGMDECLVPLDGEDRMIKDNELRAHLVDPLPVGASLVAIFDSCHSASLLDLEHLRCNRVFVPWLSKGKRKTDELRNRMVRRLEIPVETPPWSPTSRTVYQSARTSPTRIRSRRTSIDTLGSPVLSPRQSLRGPGPSSPLSPLRPVFSNLPVPDLKENEVGTPCSRKSFATRISRSHTSSRTSYIPAPLKLWDTNKENLGREPLTLATGNLYSSNFMSPTLQSALPSAVTLCESPVAGYCQGWCRGSGGDMPLSGRKDAEAQLADVLSLGSCKDSELSWENEEGIGMTQALVQVLKKDPHPTLRDLITKISHTLHGLARERHLRAKAWKKYRDAHAIKSSDFGSFDTETFQHPQIASHKPLDMDTTWDL
ncbi:peptidase C14, caspase domain-containing protein [Mycena olivaceomarginata]|nr:peptidase C14, caspase domain-containing protein [Mycena olivaceomarginata]